MQKLSNSVRTRQANLELEIDGFEGPWREQEKRLMDRRRSAGDIVPEIIPVKDAGGITEQRHVPDIFILAQQATTRFEGGKPPCVATREIIPARQIEGVDHNDLEDARWRQMTHAAGL